MPEKSLASDEKLQQEFNRWARPAKARI